MQTADEQISFHEDEVRRRLRAACDEAGSIAAWARAHHISVQAVHDVLQGRNGVSGPLARRLGFDLVRRYIVREDAA